MHNILGYPGRIIEVDPKNVQPVSFDQLDTFACEIAERRKDEARQAAEDAEDEAAEAAEEAAEAEAERLEKEKRSDGSSTFSIDNAYKSMENLSDMIRMTFTNQDSSSSSSSKNSNGNFGNSAGARPLTELQKSKNQKQGLFKTLIFGNGSTIPVKVGRVCLFLLKVPRSSYI
jgi:hypothetical protein